MNTVARAFAAGFTALIACTTALAPAKAQTVEEIKQRGAVNIGMLVDFPPFGILDLNGQPDGYDADVSKLLAEDLGVDVNIVPVTGPNRIPYLLSGQVDVLVASLGISPERAQQVDFSQPYAGIEIFVFGDKDVAVADAAALTGKNIGVARASTQDVAVTAIAPEGTTIQRFDDDASAVQALLSGQVPLIGVSNVVIAQIQQTAPDRFDEKFSLRQQVQGIATRKGSDEFLAYVNDFIKRKKEDGSLNEIHEKWLQQPLPDFIAQASE
ncbi:amino acid ABC transporter substrate-binding protein, PAAT family (TC 3.A.1.3.-) [Aureimonas altamirensis DSM 21988]|jgi:polar amino acid transport system substrate-binding protein|uniref:Amino acid ABC transporter substrate-binding protein, PAAT family (TC 3.A.1.3.-) n=1 Tax=Aureimonas altamirensis DSM 21988 TaxID=1121026 RepID=A0ABY1IQ32_9HYPH|nr:transporter substrate-binding domain-containing protein [Aureimonas altamirensis]UHD46301.1 transporter substrate-binding domain-containing protein [Aureimonas altamirensis]SHJ83371.1 amino acid ABC transporter substrate-binding protein, PAAT family (TC 3.A.1.3.-) [Aureimonas altamirensis DSM 21988]